MIDIRKNTLTITAIVFCLITAGLIMYKVFFLGYNFSSIIPRVKYDVTVNMSFYGFGEPVSVRTYLPISDYRQHIIEEVNSSPELIFEMSIEEGGRIGRWSGDNVTGAHHIVYSFSVQTKKIAYQIEDNLNIPGIYPENLAQYLISTPVIQVNHPIIEEIYYDIVPQTRNIGKVLRAIFDYVYAMKPMPFKGLTCAVTAAKLGEASCNGKSRLFVALARRANIPSRLVGGLILESGTKRTSHQWVEVFINGHWVPYDALNNHFASIPDNYLVLYRGDKVLFGFTPHINFDYLFRIRRHLTPHYDFIAELEDHPLHTHNLWTAFERIGISMDLIRIIIMLPLGAFLVVIFRNVIGMETFGTFLPALIAVASRESGLLWGILGFILIAVLVSLIHYPMEKRGLLHTPKMGILLSCVVVLMLALTVIGVRIELFALSHISLLPIAVLTITAERFAILQIEEGLKRALKVMFMTIIVVGCCYFAMNSLAMEAIFLAFPELLLVLVVLNLWLGRWIGMRVTEFGRFRWILKQG